MRKRNPLVPGIALAALAAFVAAPAGAQDLPGDPVRGRDLAVRVCAECHKVEKGDRSRDLPDPPAFQILADDPAMTPLALRVFLTTPHANMPNLILTDAEVDDVIAYIHGLKRAD